LITGRQFIVVYRTFRARRTALRKLITQTSVSTIYFNSEHHNELARLAVRIFETVANSVILERAFLAMNLIITKLRNMLDAKKVDKLIFIYMNQRVLDKAGDLLLGDWAEHSDNEKVELEELLLLRISVGFLQIPVNSQGFWHIRVGSCRSLNLPLQMTLFETLLFSPIRSLFHSCI
jgi:hypothetical protein